MSMLDSVQPMPVVMRNRCVNCSLLIPRNHPQHSLQQASTTMITILRSWITPTELSSESVLCTECTAILQDRANTFIDGVNPLPLPAFGHRSICFSCGLSILRASRTHAVRSDRPERNIILRKVPLHLVSRLERVCNACWLAAYREVRRQNQQVWFLSWGRYNVITAPASYLDNYFDEYDE
ncbi:hypothetical protein PYW07_016730 [Mythimna separata]|uniref:Uncharacterized protein n=1 Tax=Mythimna separata TaxID=271217 RepID=A0AAD7YM69_MYTSE|nr:hypothetical protein PYW07_016730 [Mythimna separata]